MRNLLPLILGFLPIISFSQNLIEENFPTENGLINYNEVVQVDSSLTAEDLYINAKKWLVVAFKSSKSVVQTDDKEAKLIIVKSFISKGHNSYISSPQNWFTLKIEMKDGRYRYSLYDIRYEFYVSVMGQRSHTESTLEQWMKSNDKPMTDSKRQKVNEELTKYCKELDSEFRAVISSIKSGMSKIESSNW